MRLGLPVTSGVGELERGRVASKARLGPGAVLGAVLRGKIVVELVTAPLTAKVAALVSGGETGPAANIKIDAGRSEMVSGAAGVKPDKLTPLALAAGNRRLRIAGRRASAAGLIAVKLIWW